MLKEGVCIKYPNCGVRLGSTDSFINIYDSQGRYAADIKVEVKDDKLLLTVFHPDEEPKYTKFNLYGKGKEEFLHQRHQNFKFYDFDWTNIK